MRLIDADAFDKCLSGAEIEATKSRKYVFSSAINTIRGNLANFPTVNQWIPCSERLPKSYKDVLVYYEYYRYCNYGAMCRTYGIGYCSHDGIWHGDVSGTKARCLAWMPLPDAYEEDD